MARKHIEVFQSVRTVHNCRLYDHDFRKLFGLPISKGKITGAVALGQTVTITFEIERHKFINHKLGGK